MVDGMARDDGPAPKRRRITATTAEQEHDIDNDAEHEGPACQSCRKRKAKCTRQQPCSHCLHMNIECVYDGKKGKPGMRTGAIESLNSRLATLEQMFLGQGVLLKPLLEQALQSSDPRSYRTSADTPPSSLSEQLEKLKNDYVRLAESTSTSASKSDSTVGNSVQTSSLHSRALAPLHLDSVVGWYFQHIHPWIPILHVKSFRENIRDQGKSAQYTIVLDAIVSLCLRFCPDTLGSTEQKQLSLKCRHSVILQSMEKFSVESLQALVIVAFDIIGSGRGPSAWSVVGSMTRTVEQLRLSVEEEDGRSENGDYLIRRMTFLRKSDNWIETEERRRVFWNVFLMDRFCSIATGWNNSLTSADVKRRLPCEGAIWEAGRPVQTPLFGIAERPSTSQQALTPASERQSADDGELNSIGGFAFCIEATESLNLVTSFFLQHPVAFNHVQDMQIWLMRFKELDLRLVKWRLFLPSRWRNASVLNKDGIMDPNLTLAHITHNTAVIQLHQCIAYPAPQWRACSVRLPSDTSSETCLQAASEISTIAEQYLRQSSGITNPQFSFCLFIAGRVLLAHSTYNGVPLHPAFETISASLAEIGQRWVGAQYDSAAEAPENLALRFSKRLGQAQRAVLGSERLSEHDPTLDIRQPVYSDQLGRSRASSTTSWQNQEAPLATLGGENVTPHVDHFQSPDSISLAFPPLPMSYENSHGHANGSALEQFDDFSAGQQDLNTIFDDQYQQMLRVTTFADTHFDLDMTQQQPI